jgi:hypothetical protein
LDIVGEAGALRWPEARAGVDQEDRKAAGPDSEHQVEEVTLRDGTRIVVVDGVPYGEADVKSAKLRAAKNRLGEEALGCGMAAAWIYIGLPVVGLVLAALVMGLASCSGLLAGAR